MWNLDNFCGKAASHSTPEVPSSDVKTCKVVLEDIFSYCGAGKLRVLWRSSQEKAHKTCSHHTNEKMLLSNMQVKPPIAWGKLTDERSLQLDDIFRSKLTNSGRLSERLICLESTISAEAATLFGHSPPTNHNLVGQIHRTELSVNLMKEKNLLLAQL